MAIRKIIVESTMKTFVFLLALVALTVGQEFSVLTTHPFVTFLDHFRPQDSRMVNFTYTINRDFYDMGGPIFVFVNDGGRVKTEFIESGLVYDIARETGGALVTFDHRYSGDNIPTATASFEDLEFLTVDQALGDIAALIMTVQRDINGFGPVILWGSGYGGTLATFARKKFPHLVDAVFASSPVFRAASIDNTYYDNLSMIIRQRGGTECGDRVNAAFYVLEYLIENREAQYLQERLGLCELPNLDNPQEIAMVVYRFIDVIDRYVQTHELSGLQLFCHSMEAIQNDPFNSLLRWINYAYGAGVDGCINANYETVVAALRNTAWDETPQNVDLSRATVYLMCTQVGGLKTTSDFALDLFPAELITDEYQFRFCEDILGESYDRHALAGAVEALNLMHGGQDQKISHVVFSNAGLNPLIHHGIADYDQFESAVVFLANNARGADLRSISGDDNEDLDTAKRTISAHLTRWATGRN